MDGSATEVFLDEFSPAGSLIETIPMPVAASGANNPLLASGSATSEGQLSLSANGADLVLTGYSAPLGTASISGTTAAADPRVVGLVNSSGGINTTTAPD